MSPGFWFPGLQGSSFWVLGLLKNYYSAGFVEGNDRVGGLVGLDNSDSFWDIQTSGQLSSAGRQPKTTAELKQRATFEDDGWDFLACLDY